METKGIDLDKPPTVTGRHRDTALAAWRRRTAVQMVLTGSTYQQTADELGYANRGTVHRIVQQTLADREEQTVDTHRALEEARLDALQKSYWHSALAGDFNAARIVLRIIGQRCRLLGLFTAPRSSENGPGEKDAMYTFDEAGSLVPADDESGARRSIGYGEE